MESRAFIASTAAADSLAGSTSAASGRRGAGASPEELEPFIVRQMTHQKPAGTRSSSAAHGFQRARRPGNGLDLPPMQAPAYGRRHGHKLDGFTDLADRIVHFMVATLMKSSERA